MRRVAVLFFALVLCASCSEPPQKEIDRAQGALDAARAAGAELYATTEFAEASTALQQSHEAVTQRDYRLALSRALDASQRAQESARQAADGQARARSEAEVAVHASAEALSQLEARLGAGRGSASELKAAQQALSNGQRMLQNARSALAAGKFLDAHAAVKDTVAQVTEQINALDDQGRSKPVRRRR